MIAICMKIHLQIMHARQIVILFNRALAVIMGIVHIIQCIYDMCDGLIDCKMANIAIQSLDTKIDFRIEGPILVSDHSVLRHLSVEL